MKVLITGSGGQLASELTKSAPDHFHVSDLSVNELDITCADAVHAVVDRIRPDVLINGSAYTAVDKAESDEETAHQVNAQGPRNLAAAASSIGCKLIQPSTDFVFDGDSDIPWGIDSKTNPLSVYGRTKRDGELAVLNECSAPWTIVRTAWVYSATGSNFVRSMLGFMKDGRDLRIINDQQGTPTWARSLASAIWSIIDREIVGIQHWTDDGNTSWYGFACAIAEIGVETGMLASMPNIDPIPTSEYPTPATRPAYSVLDKSETWQLLAGADCMPPLDWKKNLRTMMLELKNV
jgi:dTDP-4-dehydrorhamnose reductase